MSNTRGGPNLSRVWPSASGRYADLINLIPKYVVSRTLTGPLNWNAELLGDDPVAAVAALKAQHRDR